MAPVFGHGRLRLYLLKLLGESPRHGYEVIRLLEERFHGLYAPSAGTVYPRLAKLEAEGLVRHAEEGGRKVYSLTLDGERELGDREDELTDLEREIRDSLAALAAEIADDVSGSARDLRQEVKRATAEAPPTQAAGYRASDRAAWQAQARRAREESRRARREARQAREDARQAREQAGQDARQAREQAGQEARDHFEQAARRIQERVQAHGASGDWHGAIREGLDSLGREIGGFARFGDRPSTAWPAWGHESEDQTADVTDPERELQRLLDAFRDEVRDAARDHGVTQDQLREARRHLSTAAAHLVALLRSPHG
ncbi:helix-turn-helix transcriptional regulator [Streptomyces sp. B6B3]|uniref:helix-turn-helix transcriptional regulator n=1 Tax=Streptomyces sp. B6B3 TaxID=3153570 RepID=UPI00325E01B5